MSLSRNREPLPGAIRFRGAAQAKPKENTTLNTDKQHLEILNAAVSRLRNTACGAENFSVKDALGGNPPADLAIVLLRAARHLNRPTPGGRALDELVRDLPSVWWFDLPSVWWLLEWADKRVTTTDDIVALLDAARQLLLERRGASR
jgi:hypothetical protein